MESFARSDLAAECGAHSDGDGIRIQRGEAGGCRILRVQIKTKAAGARIGKTPGRYVTLDFGNALELDPLELEHVRCAVSVEIRDMAQRLCGKRIAPGFSVMVAGLGNDELTPDSLGPKTVKTLSVTRHFHQTDAAFFSTVGLCEITALTPGVPGQTGMESAELVRAVAGEVKPDLVIAVDALAARSPDKLGAGVQLCDCGISPGGGIGAARQALDLESVGVPVMAVGVPLVVESSTLVCDALRRAGYSELSAELRAVLERGRRFFVCPKEVDLLVQGCAALLAGALEKAFSVQ